MSARKYCQPNWEHRCTQCRDYAPRRRVCPVYRMTVKREKAIIREVRKEFREFMKAQSAV